MVNKKRQFSYRTDRKTTRFHSPLTSLIICLFLVAISLAVFGQTIRYDFVNFDDDLYVYNAPVIKAGITIQGLALAVTAPHARNWHPLTTISHMLDCQLYGLKASGHHGTNVLLHTIAVLLLFFVLRQMTSAVWKSAIVATLFAIHLLVLSAAACGITFVLQKRAAGAIPPLPLLWRAQNALVSHIIYIWKTVWPTRLAIFYPHPNNTLTIWQVAGAMTLLFAMTLAALVLRKQRPYLFTGWFWYVGMLVPVIGLVQVGEQGHADRYTYLPHIGLFMLAVWLVADLTAVHKSIARFVVAAAGVIIVALVWAAVIQTSHWRNSDTLWTHALAVTSDNDLAHNNLGYLCTDRGELDEAISHFEEASRIRSRKLDPHYNVGSAFVQMNLADALGLKGQADEAMLHYEEAIKLVPNYADAYYNRGNILFANGRVDEAIADWEKTLQIQPNDADAHTCLGNALLRQGLRTEAIAHYEKAMVLAPEDSHSRNNIAWLLATSSDATIRDGAKAVGFANEAVQLSGGREPSFLRTLAAAYAESGRFSEAVAAARQASVIATMQGKTQLANSLEKDLVLYRSRLPLRENSLSN